MTKKTGTSMLVNLGTGGFVLYATGHRFMRLPGYLTSPLPDSASNDNTYLLEGTINGIGKALKCEENATIELTSEDPFPRHFCLPDSAGLGSPFWQAEISFVTSANVTDLNPAERKRIVMEGIIFRICQIIRDFCRFPDLPDIHISGGLADETFICRGLAACLGHPLYKLHDKEMTLKGAARLAGNITRNSDLKTEQIHPGIRGTYLRKKYNHWINWITWDLKLLPGDYTKEK